MAILRAKEIRKLDSKELTSRVHDLKLELSKERANIHIGATVTSPGRIREIRRSIARVFTVENERKLKSAKDSQKVKPVKSTESKVKKEKTDTKPTQVKPTESKVPKKEEATKKEMKESNA